MNSKIFILFCATVLMSSCNKGQKVTELKTDEQKASYAIGLSFEQSLENMKQTMPVDAEPSVDDFINGMKSVVGNTEGKSQSYCQGANSGAQIALYLNSIGASDKVDFNLVYAAIRQKFNKDSLLMNEDSIKSFIQDYFKPYDEEMREKQNKNRQARLDKQKEENGKSSQKFLEENKAKEGVQTAASGLQYRVITPGEGATPTENDKVVINYTGTTPDGKVFDSSNGTPITNDVNGFVKGFSEGVKMMPKGAKYELVIPANLAYGDQAPPTIGPNQALKFEVEMVDIQPLSPEEIKQKEAQQKQREQMMLQQQMQQQMQQQQSAGN